MPRPRLWDRTGRTWRGRPRRWRHARPGRLRRRSRPVPDHQPGCDRHRWPSRGGTTGCSARRQNGRRDRRRPERSTSSRKGAACRPGGRQSCNSSASPTCPQDNNGQLDLRDAQLGQEPVFVSANLSIPQAHISLVPGRLKGPASTLSRRWSRAPPSRRHRPTSRTSRHQPPTGVPAGASTSSHRDSARTRCCVSHWPRVSLA